MAESVFGKPIDTAVKEINAELNNNVAKKSDLSPTPVSLLGWGTYGNGVYTIRNNQANGTLVRIMIGLSNNYGVLKIWGSTGDAFKIVTEDGTLSIEQTSENSITVSGAGSHSAVRGIWAYPSFVFA